MPDQDSACLFEALFFGSFYLWDLMPQQHWLSYLPKGHSMYLLGISSKDSLTPLQLTV